jgi:phosphohistidine phosphatase
MDLYLIRHAIAAERDPTAWPDDAERPLTAEGIARFRRVARGLRAVAVLPEVVLSSPYVRTWDTARLLSEETAWPAPVRCDALAADGSPLPILKLLSQRPPSAILALVGHEPLLGILTSVMLAGAAPHPLVEFKKGGVAFLRVEGKPRPASAVLHWLLQPKVLRRLA